MEKNLPSMIKDRAESHPGGIIFYYKKEGKWIPVTWEEFLETIVKIASGLYYLGFREKEIGTIYSYNRAEWFYFDFAFQWLRGISTPIYMNSTGEQAKYVIQHTESKFLFVDTRERWNKVKPFIKELGLKKVFVPEKWEKNQLLMSVDDLIKRGEAHKEVESKVWSLFEKITPEDIYTVVYTSGTTGTPKGVMLTHRNTLYVLETSSKLAPLYSYDTGLSYLPLAHVAQRIADYAALYNSVPGYFAESLEKFPDNLVEVKPTIIVAVPRILEKIYSRIKMAVEDTPVIAQMIFRWAERTGREYYRSKVIAKKIPVSLMIRWRLANRLVFSKIKDNLGGRLRMILCGGAPLRKEIGEFFYGIGIPVLEIYGLTEVSAPVSYGTEENVRYGTVNRVFPGGEVRIAEDGEILYRGPNLFKGYYKNPSATQEVIDKDGWFHTGDLGYLDENGYLVITGRKKDLVVTSGGKNISPAPIEDKIKQLTFISNAVVVGDNRKYLTALITVDEDELIEMAKEKKIDGCNLKTVREKLGIDRIIREHIKDVNSTLASFETIKDFKILDRDFSIDEGEITPTLKVKRSVVQQKYKSVIDEMYSDFD